MDSFSIRNLKTGKAKANNRYRRIQVAISTMLRVFEICVFFIIVSRFPITMKSFCNYFHGMFISALSPRFVFVLGNIIIMALFAKSGHLSSQDLTSAINTKINIQVEKKRRKVRKYEIQRETTVPRGLNTLDDYIRCRKTDLEVARSKNSQSVLKRSEAERSERTCEDFGEDCILQRSYSEDHMSDEDFQKMVEAFIVARQQRLLREDL